MRKFLSLVLVISMIISTITMTNVFVANAAGIDDNLVFDLDFTNYNSASTDTNKGLVNSVGNTTADFVAVKDMVKGSETIDDDTINYLESAVSGGIDVVNATVNTSPDITVETWVKEDEVIGHMFLYGNVSGNWQLQVCSSGPPTPSWTIKDGTGIGNAQIPVDNLELSTWKHIVVTLDRDASSKARTIKAYVNGVLITTGHSDDIGKVYDPANVGSDSKFRISGGNYSNLGCKTKYANVKIYKGIMTAAEAKSKYDTEKVNYGMEATVEPGNGGTDVPVTDGNLAFNLDFSGYVADATSTTDADGLKNAVTGASTDITYVSGMVKGSEVVNGKTINYLDSTNATDGIDVVNAAINSSPDITLETWVKEDEVKNHLVLYGNKTNSIWQFQMTSYSGRWIPQQSSKQNGSIALGKDQWNHLVVTLDRATDSTAATLTAYVNGKKEYSAEFTNSDVYSPTADGTNPPFRISGGSYSNQGCDAKFATVKLYNDIVTAAEVKSKYDAEKANYGIEETEEPENPGTDEPENPGTDEPGTDEPGTEEPDIESNPIIFHEDFSGSEYVVGQAPPTNKGLTYWSSGTENDSSDFKVLKTEAGDKYVAGVSSIVSKSSQMVYDFDPDISKGPICLELTVKGYEPNSSGEGTGARELFRFYSNNNYKQFGTLGPAAVLSGTSGTKSADGFYHLKLILSKDASDNYVIDFYNKPGSSSYVRIDSSKYMAMKSIQKIMLAHIYPQKEAELGTTGFAISEFKAYYIIIPKITGDTTIDDLAEGDNTVDVKFNTVMDVNSLKAGSYILKQQGTENTIPVSFKAYNEGTKTLTLSLDAALLPDATYNLTVKDIASADGWALNAEDAITVARAKSANLPTAATITAPSVGATSVSANVTLPAGATTSYVFMVFDATGRVKGAKLAEITSANNAITVDVASGIKTGDTAKIIFWEKTGETGFVPVTMTPVAVTVE